MSIVLIGPADRDELVRLDIRLQERGARPQVVDSRQAPRIVLSPGEMRCGEIDLAEATACYVADLGLAKPHVTRADGSLDLQATRGALDASRRQLAAWNALLSRLQRTALVVNPPHTYELHALKPWEIATCVSRGWPVPATVTTSDPAVLRDPGPRPAHGWIAKGLVGGRGFTESFAPPATAEEASALLRQAICQVQERIVGENVRAFVAGGEVIGAAEIIPELGGETDTRRGRSRMRAIRLPPAVVEYVCAAARHWDLIFTAVDLMRDAGTGRYLLLECNSAPFFVNFEKQSGLPISARLAELLIRGRQEEAT